MEYITASAQPTPNAKPRKNPTAAAAEMPTRQVYLVFGATTGSSSAEIGPDR
jgi:hypothetical protein